jgi:carbon-monoxide dehydrogenase small subunit
MVSAAACAGARAARDEDRRSKGAAMSAVKAAAARRITVHVNGTSCSGMAEPRTHLADFLRNELKLTGTHLGCEHGVCGACTVMVDGVSARSCLMLAVQADGAQVRTIEGLSDADAPLAPLQQAFHECHALQCGFCTPGILISLTELLDAVSEPRRMAPRRPPSG